MSSTDNVDADVVDDGTTDDDPNGLLKQFQRIFAPDFDLNLYYALNSDTDDDDDASVTHIRIKQTVADINDLSTSASATPTTIPSPCLCTPLASNTSTIITSVSPDSVQSSPVTDSVSSPTSTSSMHAIRSALPHFHRPSAPLPPLGSSSPVYSISEGVTITEMVEVHRAPSSTSTLRNHSLEADLLADVALAGDDADNSQHNNNNTSCSLSSTLTDSRTLDMRTPIVV